MEISSLYEQAKTDEEIYFLILSIILKQAFIKINKKRGRIMLPKIVGDVYSSVSEKELERRRVAVQEAMAKKGVDCIVLVAFSADMGSAVKYFSDLHVGPYGAYILMPREGGITYFCHGAEGTQGTNYPYSKSFEGNYAYPHMVAFPFTNNYMPTEVVKWIKSKNYSKIGMYRQQHLSYLIVDAIRENVPGSEFISMDEEIDCLQAVKSDEEIETFKQVVKMHDNIIAACSAFIRPGRLEREIATDILKLAYDNYCEPYNIMVGSGHPIGRYKGLLAGNKRIEFGDIVDILVEITLPGGFWGEVSRTWSLGEPSKEQLEAFKDVLEIQEHIASLAKPGVAACDLMLEFHKFQEAHGYNIERRLFAHGQGFDVVARPCFMPGDTMKLQENMFITIHPVLINDRICAHITDNFLITKNGAQILNKAPREISVIDY